MSNRVDPFVHKVPPSLLRGDTRQYFEYLNNFLFQLWKRTGGGDDEIANTDLSETYPWQFDEEDTNDVAAIYPQVMHSTVREISCVSVSQNYTALPNQFVNASGGATITFPQYPDASDVLIVRNGDGSAIKLNGNGRELNGSTSGIITRQYTTIEFYYFIDENEWFAR